MKALVYNGPRDVSVTDVEDARIERPTDVLVRVTRSSICGSDLHMYEGRTDMMLSDIWPTGYHASEMANVGPGDSVVIYGAGPVGLMAALSATVKHASLVMVVDRHPDRLSLAEEIGCVPIDDSPDDLARHGQVAFDYGTFWFKGQRMGSAPDAYAHFDRRDTGWTKVVLSPAETNGGPKR